MKSEQVSAGIIQMSTDKPKDLNAKSFKSRLSNLKRRRHFVSRSESYAHELISILEDLKASITEPRAGVEAVAAFYEIDVHILDHCDDSDGTIGDVFKHDAADLFVLYASGCDDKEWLVDLVIKLNKKMRTEYVMCCSKKWRCIFLNSSYGQQLINFGSWLNPTETYTKAGIGSSGSWI